MGPAQVSGAPALVSDPEGGGLPTPGVVAGGSPGRLPGGRQTSGRGAVWLRAGGRVEVRPGGTGPRIHCGNRHGREGVIR